MGAYGNDGNGINSGNIEEFQYINNDWKKLGDGIDGKDAGKYSGHSISLSADRNIIAIGSDLNGEHAADAGHIRIFGY